LAVVGAAYAVAAVIAVSGGWLGGGGAFGGGGGGGGGGAWGGGAWPGWVAALAEYLWVLWPLGVGAVVAAWVGGRGVGGGSGGARSAARVRRALGLRFRGIDILLGLLVAMVVRALVEVAFPTTGSLLPAFAETEADRVATALVFALGSVLLVPFVEEIFFRGALQRALQQVAGNGAGAGVLAVAVTTLLFVLLHALPYGASVPVSVLLPPLLVGIGAGVLTVLTGRIGAALVTHVLFNLAGIALVAL